MPKLGTFQAVQQDDRRDGLGAVKSHVRAAAQLLGGRFGEPTSTGWPAARARPTTRSGRAVDFMVDRATGDALAACARQPRGAGITYAIWQQRSTSVTAGRSWRTRGG